MTVTEQTLADLTRLAAAGVSSINAARATGLSWDKVFSLANRNSIAFSDLAPGNPDDTRTAPPAQLVPEGVRAPLTPTEMPSAGIIDADLERELLLRWQRDGDRSARDLLMHHHEPLVRAMALHAARSGAGTEALMDLIQEARSEVLAAINSARDDKGARLCTYAGRRLQGVLNRWVMDFHCQVRIGTNRADKTVFNRFSRERRAWEAKNARPLDDAGLPEIAEKIGVAENVLRRMVPRLLRQDISIDSGFVNAHGFKGNGDSSDAMTNYRLIFKALVQPSPDEDVIARVDSDKINRIVAAEIAALPLRERRIMLARIRGSEYTDIAAEYGITKERVRQIHRKSQLHLKRRIAKMGIEPGDLIPA